MRKQECSNHPFLTRQLIAYIGNKRRLLGFLSRLFSDLERADGRTTFIDPFAGSGAVSRLARLRGYSVFASDIEEYAALLCRAALSFTPDEADRAFELHGGYAAAIAKLNEVGANAARDSQRKPGYIERNYAPEATGCADYRTERLFYTTENAAFIDAVRDAVDRMFPRSASEEGRLSQHRAEAARVLLIAPLLVEASVHANTSGVFKAYHKGFGGHGKDALSRILAPAELERIPLIEAPAAKVDIGDAAEFCRRHSADIVYLDPPYNQHQYGSNYFMLNTIARWDKPEVPRARRSDGSLREKAGIRSDWKKTRSDFCRRKSAIGAFRDLLDSIDAATIVLSYNTEGIVAFEELYDLLCSHGEVEVRSLDYTQFRGGRQSATRKNQTAEIAFLVRRGKRLAGCATSGDTPIATPASLDDPDDRPRAALATHIARSFRVASLASRTFVPDRVRERFGAADTEVNLGARQDDRTDAGFDCSSGLTRPRFEAGLRLVALPSAPDLQSLDFAVLERLEADLTYAVCRDNIEEIDVLLAILETDDSGGESKQTGKPEKNRSSPCAPGPGERLRYERRVLQLLRKLAHPRYVDSLISRYRRFAVDESRVARNRKPLESLRASARARCNISLELSS
ncbi:MAG: DNA adenine methylase [Spirochaetales bacterium]